VKKVFTVYDLHQKFVEIVAFNFDTTLTIKALNLIGTLCFYYDDEALTFLRLNIFDVS